MIKLSCIIPAYKEPLLQKTIDSLLENSELGDELEVIPALDGYRPELKKDSRVKIVSSEKNHGMRSAINAGLTYAKGEWIMKVDAHCLFAKGFDRIMLENCQENRLLIPRRYSLDDENWKVDDTRPARDYHYLEFPTIESKYGKGLNVLDWYKNNKLNLDDTMIFQGSCWMANREYFMKNVGLLDDRKETYGSFVGEQHEIGLKYWLGGGEIKVNKKTWYAHLAKRDKHYKSGEYVRIHKTAPETIQHHNWVAKHWMNDEEPGMKYPFSWLIKKFNPPGWSI